MSVSRRSPYTQRAIERVIKAALSAGLKVVAVQPDGTVITEENATIITITPLTERPRLRDARELLNG